MLQHIIYTLLYVQKSRELSLENIINELSDTYGLVCSKDYILEIINDMIRIGQLRKNCGKYSLV